MAAGVLLVLAVWVPAAHAQYAAPGLFVSDATVARGDQIQATATGCPPGLTVSFTLDGRPVGSATADVYGDATISFVVDVAPGTHQLGDSCSNSTLTLRVAAVASSDDGPTSAGPALSRTGSTSTTVLVKVAALAITAGGLLVLAARRRAT